MKAFNKFLNGVIGFSFGLLMGHVLYVGWNFMNNPEFFAAQSAPWYTGIWFYGAIALIVLLICGVIKLIIRRRI